uniref:m7GpppN-mRNA hydrolase NUDT17 n=1 Tax=Oncorhynchus kisutch TaxID=8019 RepID=A0A8C7GDQ6_ONCKI
MEKVTKILVHLSKNNVAPQCARFVQSITGHFTETLDDEVEVKCSLENNRFILCDCEKGRGIPLKYLSVAEAAAIPLDVQSRGVDVGVAILLQSANQKVLLTRRAASLRIFPNVWVPPGMLLDAGLRELREETGLKLDPGDVSAQLLGLWESVFPPMLSRGMPQRHHVVTYMLLNTSLTHQQLQASLHPKPAEVSGCLWVDASLVKAIVSAVDGEEGSLTPLEGLAPTISVSEVSPEGGLSESILPLSVLCNRAPNSGEDVERVSTGTKYALELWLKNLEGQGTRC